ncbi:riboflavin kinase [Pseudarthrobacter phenanthrenivorans]|uniref:riboflavin kinase n=1 Tax=Pseudarthrobacter phenanthrenivorans TaxID=361575 RepID=UPI00344D676F
MNTTHSRAPGQTVPGNGGSANAPGLSWIKDHPGTTFRGVVEHGDARGREIGFPTANISMPHEDLPDGVWVGTVQLEPEAGGKFYLAAVSIGRRPTYYRKGTRLLEAHLLDFDGDLYGLTVEVTLYDRVRTQKRFSGTDQLMAQIRDDAARVRSWALEKRGQQSAPEAE